MWPPRDTNGRKLSATLIRIRGPTPVFKTLRPLSIWSTAVAPISANTAPLAPPTWLSGSMRRAPSDPPSTPEKNRAAKVSAPNTPSISRPSCHNTNMFMPRWAMLKWIKPEVKTRYHSPSNAKLGRYRVRSPSPEVRTPPTRWSPVPKTHEPSTPVS